MIWDKQWIGPAYKNALRPTYELAVFAAMPDAEIPNRSASDIFRGQKWLAGQCRTTIHAAEKPVDLMGHLTELVAPDGGVVLDPFAGSGTTGVACVKNGRRFIGIEKEKKYFDIAVERISAELSRMPLLEGVT
jgi:DNA modification methylase